MFLDFANSASSFVLDSVLFETPLAGRIHDASLRQFWRYEAADAAARSVLEFALGSEVGDANFEQVYRPPSLPSPHVKREGAVGGRLATSINALMLDQQTETLNVLAMEVSLNRASEARYQRTRQDWMKWQEWMAARYARRAAAAITRALGAQRAVTRALAHKRWLFGIGSADLSFAHRQVRRQGLAGSLQTTMRQIGMDSGAIALSAKTFLKTTFGQQSFSLTRYLVDPKALAFEKGFRSALTHFANRTPAATQPLT